MRQTRRLAAILAADVAGYSRLMGADEAGRIIERLRAINPVVVPTNVNYRNPEHRKLFLSGLRLAAGETT
jgi:hypothetical protein